jgi:hypothetical protein
MFPNRNTIILAVLLAASVLALGGLGKVYFEQRATHRAQIDALVGAHQRALEARQRSEATLARLSQKNAASARAGALAGASLAAAVASAPAWAAQPVPNEVQDALSAP